MSRTNRSIAMRVFLVVWAVFQSADRADAVATITPTFADQLTVTNIGNRLFTGPNSVSRTTQLAVTPGPTPTQRYLYMSSNEHGIRRAIYDLETLTLLDGSLEAVADDIEGLGIALDGDVLYASEPYVSSASARVELSRIWRIEDRGFGARTPIVEGIPRQDHGVNNIEIVNHSLYVGIGVRTRNGAFQTWSGDRFGESAYGGTIGVIDDLRQVPSEPNAAGFYPAHPTVAEYTALINGENPLASSPYSTTAANKLRIHSTGTRNPFGISVDGDGQIWFTNNSQRTENHVYRRDNLSAADGDAFGGDGFQDDIHDQLFRAVPKADYGYRNGNWQDGNARGNTGAIDAGFFLAENRAHSFTFDNYDDPVAVGDEDSQHPAYNTDYQINNPVGLGPSSSANGMAIYQGHQLPLSLHHDAVIARWNGMITDGGDRLEYRDVVAADTATGEVRRIAAGFVNPLDVIEDELGNLIVADHGGSIYRISAVNPRATAYEFRWGQDGDGMWTDAAIWNADAVPRPFAEDQIVPDAWGTARYAVVIDRPAGNPTVTLDRDVRVESVELHHRLRLTPQAHLQIDGMFIESGGSIVEIQAAGGSETIPRIDVSGGGFTSRVEVQFVDSSTWTVGQLISMPLVAAPFVSSPVFSSGVSIAADRPTWIERDLFGQAVRQGAGADRQLLSLMVYRAFPGDANGDRVFNSSDLVQVFQMGHYEDGIDNNSNWTHGDWTGDLDFDTADLVAAFQTGGYTTAAVSTPEPSPAGTAFLAVILAVMVRRGSV